MPEPTELAPEVLQWLVPQIERLQRLASAPVPAQRHEILLIHQGSNMSTEVFTYWRARGLMYSLYGVPPAHTQHHLRIHSFHRRVSYALDEIATCCASEQDLPASRVTAARRALEGDLDVAALLGIGDENPGLYQLLGGVPGMVETAHQAVEHCRVLARVQGLLASGPTEEGRYIGRDVAELIEPTACEMLPAVLADRARDGERGLHLMLRARTGGVALYRDLTAAPDE